MSVSTIHTDVQDLLIENRSLRDEIALLQQENDILRQRLERSSSSRALPRPTRHEPPPESASDTGTNWRKSKGVPKAQVLQSATLGRPKEPNELPMANPARPAGDAPALDIGYVNRVGAEQLDQLPYGLIVLDSAGQVLFYNETESQLAGFDRNRVVGRNFFKEVAPCTQVKGFEGRFAKFVKGELGRVTFFDFAFHFERGTQEVTIAFSQGRRSGQVNVMLIRK